MNKPLTITALIDTLQGIYAEHGDVPVFDGRKHELPARFIAVVECDDWENGTVDANDNIIPAIGHAVAIGSKF